MTASDVYEIIKIGNDTARRILSRELRKAMGLYYLLWGTYPVVIAALSTASYQFDVLSEALQYRVFSIPVGLMVVMAAIAVYTSLSFRVFSMAYRVSRSPISRRHRGPWPLWTAVYYALVTAALYLAFAGPGGEPFEALEYAAAATLAVLIVSANTAHFRSGLVRARRYDYLANAALLALLPLSMAYYVSGYLLSLIWIYAGVRSLLEVIGDE